MIFRISKKDWPKTKKPTRIGYSKDEKTNKKIRIPKKSNEKID